jgi:FAD dependent oxidoreductase TIGR03364
MNMFDAVVIGGGIIGMAMAIRAKRLGQSVALIERDSFANGASIRNFGMIWPVGQPEGQARKIALRSRDIWLDLAQRGNIWIRPCGSLHVAYAPDESQVLKEFCEKARHENFQCEWLDEKSSFYACPSLNPNGLVGALFSKEECAVDPPQAIRAMEAFIINNGISVFRGSPAIEAANGIVRLSDGNSISAGRTIIATGTDLKSLYPQELAKLNIKITKLQMLRTNPMPTEFKFGPHLAFGLTLLHYESFAHSPSLPALRQRLLKEYPEHIRYGIHVMASANQRKEIIIGDSHVYGSDITPFDSQHIEELILGYLKERLVLPDPSISMRWNGEYAKSSANSIICKEINKSVWTALAPGGCGMTMCHGWAEELWNGMIRQE